MARTSSARLCAGNFISSDISGLRMSPTWHLRPVAEITTTATKDGAVDRVADPVDTITTDLRWTNASNDPVEITAVVHRPPRSVVTSNPNTIWLLDNVSSAIGQSPNAPIPVLNVGAGGGVRLKTTRSSTANIAFGRVFADLPGGTTSHSYFVAPGLTIHFRYRCAITTPGEWRTPSNGVSEAYARFVNIKMYAGPAVF